MLLLPMLVQAAEKRPKPLKIVGLATQVEPTRVSIMGEKAEEVTVQTQEDFTEKVAVGSKVTAWYFPQQDGNILQWLEYPLENSFVPPAQIRGQVKKAVILPSSGVPDAEGLFDAMASFLESQLGWYVAPRMLAEEIRDRALKSHAALEAIDPASGEVDLARYVQAQRELIRKLASETRVDAVLEANVELVQVDFRSHVAAWDGAQQPVASKTSRTLAMVASLPGDGHVPAATVVVKLWDPQGKLLWSHRRGFAVLALQVGLGNKFRDRPIPEVLGDTASVERWLRLVFDSFLPPGTSGRATARER